jgi:hypothetical protein
MRASTKRPQRLVVEIAASSFQSVQIPDLPKPQLRLQLERSLRVAPDLIVTKNGIPLAPGQLDQPTFEDAGRYVIEVNASGRQRQILAVDIDDTTTVKTLAIGDVLVPAGVPGKVEAKKSDRSVAIAAFSLGIAGIGTGAFLGLRARSLLHQSQDDCPGKVCPDQAGVQKYSDAQTDANLSTAGFTVGAAGLVVGVVAWVLGSTGEQPAAARPGWRPVVASAPGGLAIGGRW